MTTRAAPTASSRASRPQLGTPRFGQRLVAAMLWAATPAQAAPPAPSTSSSPAPSSSAPAPPLPSTATTLPQSPSVSTLRSSRSPPLSPEAAEERRRIDKAATLHDEARTLYQQGEYRAAVSRLEAAVALDPDGKELMYNLAVIHERLGEIDVAERYYRRYLKMEAQPKAREQVEAVLKRLQGAKRELIKPAPPAPPPPAPVQRREPSAKPPQVVARVRPIEPLVFVSGGIAAGAFVLGNVFAVLAIAQDPGSEERTGRRVTVADLEADADAAHRSAVVADVAMLVAGLSGAAALYLYLATPPRAPLSLGPRARLSGVARSLPAVPLVGVSLGAGGARLGVRF